MCYSTFLLWKYHISVSPTIPLQVPRPDQFEWLMSCLYLSTLSIVPLSTWPLFLSSSFFSFFFLCVRRGQRSSLRRASRSDYFRSLRIYLQSWIMKPKLLRGLTCGCTLVPGPRNTVSASVLCPERSRARPRNTHGCEWSCHTRPPHRAEAPGGPHFSGCIWQHTRRPVVPCACSCESTFMQLLQQEISPPPSSSHSRPGRRQKESSRQVLRSTTPPGDRSHAQSPDLHNLHKPVRAFCRAQCRARTRRGR